MQAQTLQHQPTLATKGQLLGPFLSSIEKMGMNKDYVQGWMERQERRVDKLLEQLNSVSKSNGVLDDRFKQFEERRTRIWLKLDKLSSQIELSKKTDWTVDMWRSFLRVLVPAIAGGVIMLLIQRILSG